MLLWILLPNPPDDFVNKLKKNKKQQQQKQQKNNLHLFGTKTMTELVEEQ